MSHTLFYVLKQHKPMYCILWFMWGGGVTSVCVCVCVCMYVYMYIYIYISPHTHIYDLTHKWVKQTERDL